MLMNAPAVYTAVTSSLHVQTPLDPTAVHVTSISMETVKTASTLQAVSSFHKFGLLVKNTSERYRYACCFRPRVRTFYSQLKKAVEPRKNFIMPRHYKKNHAHSAGNQSANTIVVI